MTPVFELIVTAREFIVLFALLGAAHYVADFAMQNDFVAKAKAEPHSEAGPHALIAHSVHHATLAALAVWISGAAGIASAAIITGLSHYWIDYGKAVLKKYSLHVDQALHFGAILLVTVNSVLLEPIFEQMWSN